MEYKLITEDRYDDVIRHLRDNFFADEPLNKAAGLCQRGFGNRDLEHHSLETLEDNLSFMAVADNNQIAGVILNGILRPGDILTSQKKLELNDDVKFKKIFQLLYTLNLKEDIFQRFNVDKAFDLRILSVDGQYRGQGIAKHLVRHSEDLAKEYGYKIMKADATGIFSQKILKSHGFEVLLEQYYDKYVDEFGQPVLNVESPHIKLQLLYKLLD
ncbi:arylalkylamine N-acetyltransferase 1 isoform X2 [Stomoxys calcitrans]|nr:arylalkylamine N-acetyltransferase 1 isoform X2 [Stomoxys calcitrans]XP_013099865.2 arylalkylamine N-acetyltransferase 1 isoform X2 [Stomoxys calcitrans]XP_013099866.2 arylalkylamine N-acetyltransferase 1 isoform X2 [Stomoxys calcitrans]